MVKRVNKNIIIILVVAIVIILAAALYFTFSYSKTCSNFECFSESMKSCSNAQFVSEQQEASWKYKIIGNEGRECKVNVRLLQAKEGELGIENLQGLDMDCFYASGVSTYPESDLSKCHGRLKEEIQTIIIKKLHTHILENLGKFDENLNKL